jgi:glycosyltransferase involved in cell wall biosynthesis
VLLVADSLDVGGAERHVVNLAAGLAQSGWAVTIACSVGGALAPIALASGVEVCPLGKSLEKRRVSVQYAWRLAEFMRRRRFGLVHAHMFASSVAAALAVTLTRLPLVITEHSEATWRSPGARWVSRQAYRRASTIIAVSESIRRRLILEDGVPAHRVATIHNACAAAMGNAVTSDSGALPNAPSGPLVGVVARLQPEKGVRYFVEAAARVGAAVPAAQFVVVGDGPLRSSLIALADQLGLARRIHFAGFCLDAPALIRRLDLLVVPSLSEGTPLVVLEAMFAGVPIVASAVGGIPEQVRDGREALLISPADSRALAQAITQLLREPQLASGLGRAARKRAIESFSPGVLLPHTENVYHSAVRNRRGGELEQGWLATQIAR